MAKKLEVLFPEEDDEGERLTPFHKFLASRIEEKAWENQCSNVLLSDTESCLLLLPLICVFLVFLKCCSRSFLKPARPVCDGRPFASPLFRRLAGRGTFFCCFPFRWALQFAFSLTRCLTLQDATPCCRKDFLHGCGRPCDTLSCLFFTAPWLRQSQSIKTG